MIFQNKQRRFARLLPLALVAAMATSACTALQPPTAPPGEPPVSPGVPVTPPAASIAAAVFFVDWQAQHLIPEMRQVPELTADQLVKELLAGPQDPHLNRALPAGVRLLEPVKVENGTAYVNLSKELKQAQGSAAATAALNALRLTLTEIPGIERVQVLIEGSADDDLGGLSLGPMDRGFYPYTVFLDPERVEYLQGRHDQGLDAWRASPLEVARWEGRMFGFTAAELEAAKLVLKGNEAEVQVTRGGATYTILLTQNPGGQKEGIWSIRGLDPLVRYAAQGVPKPVQDALVDPYKNTTIGITRPHGDRLFLLAAVEKGTVRIDSAQVKDGTFVVYVTEAGTGRVDVAAVMGADAGLPVEFRWKTPPTGEASKVSAPDTLPVLRNPHKLPAAALSGDIAVVKPAPNQTVSGAITVTGYARHLFEANLVARLLDQQGTEIAQGFTTAAACCYDWGSFQLVLQHSAPAGNYVLELGDYSPADGEWKAKASVPVTIAP